MDQYSTCRSGLDVGTTIEEITSPDDNLCVTPGFLQPNTGLLKVSKASLSGLVPIPELDQPVFPGFGYGATCAIGNVGI